MALAQRPRLAFLVRDGQHQIHVFLLALPAWQEVTPERHPAQAPQVPWAWELPVGAPLARRHPEQAVLHPNEAMQLPQDLLMSEARLQGSLGLRGLRGLLGLLEL